VLGVGANRRTAPSTIINTGPMRRAFVMAIS
jgi:hypothetical protein